MTTKKDKLVIAIVGSGPSGFYAAEALFKSTYDVQINMIEKLPTPFGLVRYGVAPDHPKLKQVIMVFNKIAENPKLHFFGNIELDKDITLEELQATHHAVILCYGSAGERKLDIPGIDSKGSYSARKFVAWYNGHPEAKQYEFDLSQESAVIIGQGNVAADVCRILTKPTDILSSTDIAEHARAQLAESMVREIHIVGRRGPAQAKFSSKELRELGALSDCNNFVEREGFVIENEDRAELEDQSNENAAKCIALFEGFNNSYNNKKYAIHYHFLLSPLEIYSTSHIEYMTFTRNSLSGSAFHRVVESSTKTLKIKCGLCFSSIGYKGEAVLGAPFNSQRGIIPNDKGRVIDDNTIKTGLYVSGWIKRGPSGIIGTNRVDSLETVTSLLEDIDSLVQPCSGESFISLLQTKGCNFIDYEQWKKIDCVEMKHGQTLGKPREKITDINKMLEIANE